MFNMLSIALSQVDVVARPSRATHALNGWLAERHAAVYPTMEGYDSKLRKAKAAQYLDITTPVRLPDALLGERYAFVSLPVSEFLEGGGVAETRSGLKGRSCPVPAGLAPDSFVPGIVVMSQRCEALASWMEGSELSSIECDIRRRTVNLSCDISTKYLLAKLNDEQRKEAGGFEEAKEGVDGLHFLAVQRDEEDEEPRGFWLMREMEVE